VNSKRRKRKRVRARVSLVGYWHEVPDVRFADHPDLRGGVIRDFRLRMHVKGKLGKDGLMRPKYRKRKAVA
jgi:hypothetical protein